MYIATILTFLIVLPQATVYASESGILSEQMIDDRVQDALIAHAKKVKWQTEQRSKQPEEYVSLKTKDMLSYMPPKEETFKEEANNGSKDVSSLDPREMLAYKNNGEKKDK